jgi:hypothetical protein
MVQQIRFDTDRRFFILFIPSSSFLCNLGRSSGGSATNETVLSRWCPCLEWPVDIPAIDAVSSSNQCLVAKFGQRFKTDRTYWVSKLALHPQERKVRAIPFNNNGGSWLLALTVAFRSIGCCVDRNRSYWTRILIPA